MIGLVQPQDKIVARFALTIYPYSIGMRSNLSGFVEQAPMTDQFRDRDVRLNQIDVEPGVFKAIAAHCTDFLGLFVFDSNDYGHFDARWRQLHEQFHSNLSFKCI